MDIPSTKDRKLLQSYFRLILSYKDFKQTLMCAQWLETRGAYVSEDELAVSAHHCSMVVSYVRPFNSYGKSEAGVIPPLQFNFLPNASDEEREIHDYILLCRNKLIAHSDAELLDLEPMIATDLPGDIVVPLVNDALAPFKADYTLKVANLAERWMRWAVEERLDVEDSVRPLLKRTTWENIWQ